MLWTLGQLTFIVVATLLGVWAVGDLAEEVLG